MAGKRRTKRWMVRVMWRDKNRSMMRIIMIRILMKLANQTLISL